MEIVAVKKINRNFNIKSFFNKKGYRPNTNYTYFDRIIFNYKQADVWHLSAPKRDSIKLDIFFVGSYLWWTNRDRIEANQNHI